jgi:hypothetical protein
MGVRKVGESPAARNQGGGWISPAAASGSVPATARTEVDDIRLEKLPGGATKLLRALAEAGVQRDSRSTVEQRARCGGARRRWC